MCGARGKRRLPAGRSWPAESDACPCARAAVPPYALGACAPGAGTYTYLTARCHGRRRRRPLLPRGFFFFTSPIVVAVRSRFG